MGENLTIFHHTKKIVGSLFLGILLILGLLITTIIVYYFLLWEVPMSAYTEPRVYPLEGLNSPYDDYNAAGPGYPIDMDALVVFASNAASKGGKFSLETGRLYLYQDYYYGPGGRVVKPPLPAIISERTGAFSDRSAYGGNYRGPTALKPSITKDPKYQPDQPYWVHQSITWQEGIFLNKESVWIFDGDHEGNRNLYFLDYEGEIHSFFGNDPAADDAYAAYDFNRDILYFSSNRSGRYQIYSYHNTSGNLNFKEWLGDTSLAGAISLVEELSCEGNTMAPCIEGDLLIFASDRSGGYGGFDLYYSFYGDNTWGTPLNMKKLMPKGVQVNTSSNEFRPALFVKRMLSWPEDQNATSESNLLSTDKKRAFGDQMLFLVFSSDRPGGLGGYDLYITALPDFEY